MPFVFFGRGIDVMTTKRRGSMEGTTQLDRLLDVHEAAEVVGCSHYTVRAWIRQGRLKAARLGRLVRLSKNELERFIASGREEGR